MYVLTVGVNDYDQHGEYFVKAWVDKPTAEDIVGLDNASSTKLDLVSAKLLLSKGWYEPEPTVGCWGSFGLLHIV